jgi:hypothetical protein
MRTFFVPRRPFVTTLLIERNKESQMGGMLVLAMVQWGFLTAVIARGKRRNAALWFLLGAALPVMGLIGALAVGTARRHKPSVRKAREMPPRRRREPIGKVAFEV